MAVLLSMNGPSHKPINHKIHRCAIINHIVLFGEKMELTNNNVLLESNTYLEEIKSILKMLEKDGKLSELIELYIKNDLDALPENKKQKILGLQNQYGPNNIIAVNELGKEKSELIINKFKDLYKDSTKKDSENAKKLEDFFSKYTISFLGGNNSKNFKIESKQTNTAYVLGFSGKLQDNQSFLKADKLDDGIRSSLEKNKLIAKSYFNASIEKPINSENISFYNISLKDLFAKQTFATLIPKKQPKDEQGRAELVRNCISDMSLLLKFMLKLESHSENQEGVCFPDLKPDNITLIGNRENGFNILIVDDKSILSKKRLDVLRTSKNCMLPITKEYIPPTISFGDNIDKFSGALSSYAFGVIFNQYLYSNSLGLQLKNRSKYTKRSDDAFTDPIGIKLEILISKLLKSKISLSDAKNELECIDLERIDLMQKNENKFANLTEELKKNNEILIPDFIEHKDYVIQNIDKIFEKIEEGKSLTDNPQNYNLFKEFEIFAKQIVSVNANNLYCTSDKIKNSKEIVKLAVAQNGLALGYASAELRNDKELVKIAVAQNGLALVFASEGLKKDKDIVKVAVGQNGDAIRYALVDIKELANGKDGCSQKKQYLYKNICSLFRENNNREQEKSSKGNGNKPPGNSIK